MLTCIIPSIIPEREKVWLRLKEIQTDNTKDDLENLRVKFQYAPCAVCIRDKGQIMCVQNLCDTNTNIGKEHTIHCYKFLKVNFFFSRGMTTIDIALTNVDINQCDRGSGGQFQFEIFAGTHRCKNETTQVR